MNVPAGFRSRRFLIALLIGGLALYLAAPDTAARSLPFLFLLVCPLMMVFMMGGMHRAPGADLAPRPAETSSPEALRRRLVELAAEQRSLIKSLALDPTDEPAETATAGRPA